MKAAIIITALFALTATAEASATHKKQKPKPQPAPAEAQCFERIKVVGSQWVGESGAYDSAVKAAKERIRWEYGEMAIDERNWKNIERRCSQSSVGEIAGQVMHRCEIVLTPCRPLRSTGEGK